MDEKNKLVEDIVKEEWYQFDHVQNQGGRAFCQDDWETFKIMRTSQFMPWPEDLLRSYFMDLLEANLSGWNLVSEKYARTMQSTAPSEYEALKDKLPYRTPERLQRQERVIQMHVAWNEEFSAKYPHYAGQGRRIHSYEDTPYSVSAETYLRGELSTYSDRTFKMYEAWMDELSSEGKNLPAIIGELTAQAYGYASVEEADRRIYSVNSGVE